jgi:hypothetical protein
MNDLEKQIRDALANVAQTHSVEDECGTSPLRRAQILIEQGRANVRAERRPAVIDERESIARLRTPAPAARKEVTPAERHKYEGRYADVSFADGYATVLVHTVEYKAGQIMAYVMRLDRRTREYVTLDKLTDVRDRDEK